MSTISLRLEQYNEQDNVMTYRSKVFYFTLLLCVFAYPGFAQAHDDEKPKLYNDIKEPEPPQPVPVMQTKRYNPPKPELAPTPEKIAEEKEAQEKAEAEEKKAKDKKLWEKYKTLAAGEGQKEKQDSDNETDTKKAEPEEKEEKTTENKIDAKEMEKQIRLKQSTGLQSLIEDYKKSQSSKSNMATRSYGKID